MSEKTMRKITAHYMANSVYLTNENERLEIELERTRKALDVAVDALKRIKNHATATDTAICRAEIALEQMTALEQKDVK